MSNSEPVEDDIELNLADGIGSQEDLSFQVLTLYIPDKDRDNAEIGNQRKWVLEAAELLARIGGGVTIMPPAEGGWFDEQNNEIIWEHPVIVYTYIKADQFIQLVPRLREFLHRMGRETNQGEVVVEFVDQLYRITQYDPASED